MKRAVVVLLLLLTSACGFSSSPGASSGKVEVVAAENFWGSIASQIGGDKVHVTSIIVNPDTDPHSYEPSPADARLFALAGYVIVNGAGYDAWATKLIAANPVPDRKVLTVSELLGKKDGDNPHFWYSAAYVQRVIDRVGSDLGTPDAAARYKASGLRAYDDTLNAIKQKYAGTRVGATESVFAYVAESAGLDLITPPTYMNAISEGADPTAADKATVQRQIQNREIKVFVFNFQNSTPEVQGLVDKATAEGIPIVKISETMTPATASYQDWQTAELNELLHALGG